MSHTAFRQSLACVNSTLPKAKKVYFTKSKFDTGTAAQTTVAVTHGAGTALLPVKKHTERGTSLFAADLGGENRSAADLPRFQAHCLLPI
jgi:hypothetical protein